MEQEKQYLKEFEQVLNSLINRIISMEGKLTQLRIIAGRESGFSLSKDEWNSLKQQVSQVSEQSKQLLKSFQEENQRSFAKLASALAPLPGKTTPSKALFFKLDFYKSVFIATSATILIAFGVVTYYFSTGQFQLLKENQEAALKYKYLETVNSKPVIQMLHIMDSIYQKLGADSIQKSIDHSKEKEGK
jgi:hypothetical protein